MKNVVATTSRKAPVTRRTGEADGNRQTQPNTAAASTMKQIMAEKNSGLTSLWTSMLPKACGSRYRNRTEYTTSRTIACSCSVSGRAARRARRPARIDFSAIRPGPGSLRQPIGKPFAAGKDFVSVPREDLDKLRIKMPAGMLHHVDKRFFHWPRRFVGANRSERVVDVRDDVDACCSRYVLAPEACRVAAAVVLLVMAERDHGGHLQISRRAVLQHVVANARVGLHDSQVLAVQPSGILQDSVRYADFSDIVHRRSQLDRILLGRGQPDALGDQRGVLGHPHQVHSGHLVALLGGLRQPKQRLDFASPQFAGGFVDLLLENPGSVFLENFMPAQAQEIAAARAAFEPVDRANQEVGSPRLQGPVADFAIVDYRDTHDRNVLVAENAAQAPDDLDSVQARHLVVGEHHVHGMLARVFDALQRIGERGDLQTRVKASHDLAQHDAPCGLVVDDQDLEWRELGFDRIVNQRKRSRRRRGFHWNSLPGPIGRLPYPRSQVQVQLHYIWREIARNPNSLRFRALPPSRPRVVSGRGTPIPFRGALAPPRRLHRGRRRPSTGSARL